jgi:hypothetical protein
VSLKPREPNSPSSLPSLALRRPLLTVWLFALVTQAASVRWIVGSYVEPSVAPLLGRTLAATGRLELPDWSRFKGETRWTDPPLRAFELPGEPLWIAAGAKTGLDVWDYWNIPIAALLVVSVAAVAGVLGGPVLALAAGILAAIDPVTLLHASNRDDAVLGSALLWLVFALLALGRRDPVSRLALFAAAGAAAITRTEATIVIALLLAVRPIRREAAIAVAGAVIALGAWGARNQLVLGHFVVGSTHDGITLWESNGPFARQSLARGQVDVLSLDRSVMAPMFRETQQLDEVGADAYFRREAVHYIVAHPLGVAETATEKIAISLTSIHPNLPLGAPRNLAGMLDNVLLFLLAGFGLARLARSTTPARAPAAAAAATGVLAIVCVVTLAMLAIGPAGMRYWLTLRGALWILAAQSAVSISGRLIPRIRASFAPALPSASPEH